MVTIMELPVCVPALITLMKRTYIHIQAGNRNSISIMYDKECSVGDVISLHY